MATSKNQSGFVDNWQRGKSVTECNLHMLETEDFTDVTFLVGSEKHVVRAHRYVLASRSCVFHAMFCGGMAEQREIIIPDIEVNVFRDLLRFLYTDCLEITAENAAGLLYSSRKYDVESLFEKSASFLEESLTEENLCGILEKSHGYGETDLEEKALKMLQQANVKVTQSPAFRDLCSSCFGNFIKSENLQLEEKEVFEATLSWTKSECERQAVGQSHKNMRKVLGELVYEIRFASLSLEYLTKVVGPSGVLSDGERIRIMDRISDSGVDIGSFKSSRRILTVSKSQGINYLKRFAGVQTTTNPSVTYHAITFSTNKTVSLLGCQLYGSENLKTNVGIEVYSAWNLWMSHPVNQQLTLSNIVNDVMFPSPFSIQAGCLYTIHVRVNPSAKVEGCGGKEKISESDVVFAFRKTVDRTSFSSVKMGQISGLIWKH